jgi:hypothetical protein
MLELFRQPDRDPILTLGDLFRVDVDEGEVDAPGKGARRGNGLDGIRLAYRPEQHVLASEAVAR